MAYGELNHHLTDDVSHATLKGQGQGHDPYA